MLPDPPVPARTRPDRTRGQAWAFAWARRSGRAWGMALLFAMWALPTSATAEVLFRVHGLPTHPDPSGLAIDRAMIDAMPQHDYVTGTVWTVGVSRFSGVLLSEFLAAIGADGQHSEGQQIEIRALDGYVAVIPVSEIDEEAPLLATRIDGRPMHRRDRGPAWLVYPYDRDPVFRSDTVLQRSVWQIERIDIHRAGSP